MPQLSQGETFYEDVPMSRRDGRPILVRLIARGVDIGDRSHGIVWAAEDVTERRAAESALRERQEFYEQLFTSGSAIKLLLDPQTGQIVDANPAAAVFYGLSLDQLLGRAIWSLDELEPEQSLALLRAAQAELNSRFVYRHRMADGSHRDVEVFTGPLRVRDRDLVMSIVHDVTDRLSSEQKLAHALHEQENQARELARSNAELEQFAYVASHDLRQPLRQVASYVSLLERMYADKLDEEGRQFIGFARSGAERMDRLIVDLLEYSRIGRKVRGRESVHVAEMLAEPVRIMSPLAEEAGGSVRLELAEDVGAILGERIELERLIQNLIGNAIKYRAPERPPVVTVTAVRSDLEGEMHIAVSDNGIGIAPEHFERIFGIFQRLHGRDEYEGTGIGLAICKKIVDHHKGRIWIESKLGEGSVFHVALPLSEGAE
jgi:PAS domain S-box-containing protein